MIFTRSAKDFRLFTHRSGSEQLPILALNLISDTIPVTYESLSNNTPPSFLVVTREIDLKSCHRL